MEEICAYYAVRMFGRWAINSSAKREVDKQMWFWVVSNIAGSLLGADQQGGSKIPRSVSGVTRSLRTLQTGLKKDMVLIF